MFANRLSTGGLALALFLVLPFVARAEAAPATLSVSRSGDEVIVLATAEVTADDATTWDVLIGYERLPDFIPDMSTSHTLERDGSDALVQQSGRAGFGPFKQDFSVTWAVHEVPQQSVTAHAVAGDFTRFESSYRLHANGAGHTWIAYAAVIEPKDGIPPLVGLPVMRIAIRAQFEALLAEIDRRAHVAAG
jgi:ribosome-associated toxin RatA of RatAB toxin-antitoxin module